MSETTRDLILKFKLYNLPINNNNIFIGYINYI